MRHIRLSHNSHSLSLHLQQLLLSYNIDYVMLIIIIIIIIIIMFHIILVTTPLQLLQPLLIIIYYFIIIITTTTTIIQIIVKIMRTDLQVLILGNINNHTHHQIILLTPLLHIQIITIITFIVLQLNQCK